MEEQIFLNQDNITPLEYYDSQTEESSDIEPSVERNYDQKGSTINTVVFEKAISKINYFLNIGDCFNIGIEEHSDRLIIEKNCEKIYTERYLEDEYKSKTVYDINNFHINHVPLLFKYKNQGHVKFRYIIGIRHNNDNLLFVPVFVKDDVIISFACASLNKYDIINDERFTRDTGGYPTADKISLHEKVYGKKAEKGGWYKIQRNTEESDVKAIWITMISGRSINQYDPNPDNRDFYYYYNPENGFNIKAPTPQNFIEGFDDIPKVTEGNPGDFYKDKNGDIYMKVDAHNIDHIDAEPFDARTHKLREISISANMANKRKNHEGFIGVMSPTTRPSYRGSICHRGKMYIKFFKTEIEAAKFYDYHSLALHGVRTTINNVLPLSVQNDLLLYGIEKIPAEYRVKENSLPKGISKKNDKEYQVWRKYDTLKINKIYDTYEKAYTAWQEFENEIVRFKETEKEKILDRNKANYDDKHGYIVIQQDGKEYRIKLSIDAYKEFVNCHWVMKNGKPRGVYKGKDADLHVHVMGFYIKDYNRREMGTVDHRDQDPLDCTKEALRPASASLQAQNQKSKNRYGYKGVFLCGRKFWTEYKGKRTGGFDCLEDAARNYNSLVEKDMGRDENGRIKGYVNIIPEGKRTTVKDLFSMENLTSELLQEANVTEIKSIVLINPELHKYLPIELRDNRSIHKQNYKIVRDKIIIEILKLE